jgi:hypothetical protein
MPWSSAKKSTVRRRLIRWGTDDNHWSTGSGHFFCFLRPSTHFWIHECNQLLYTPLTNLCLSFKANAECLITWQKVTPSLFVLLICRPIQRVPNHTGVTESFHAFVGHGALSSLLDLRAAGGRCGLWLSWTGWGASPRPQSQALQSEVTLGILGSVLGLFIVFPGIIWIHLVHLAVWFEKTWCNTGQGFSTFRLRCYGC